MIHAVYHRKYQTVTVEGHAYSDEPGKDLVCAGASAIVYTLAANAMQLQEQGAVKKADVKLEPGNARIHCKAVSRYKATVTVIMDAVCMGLEMLASQYPQYIRYEIHE